MNGGDGEGADRADARDWRASDVARRRAGVLRFLCRERRRGTLRGRDDGRPDARRAGDGALDAEHLRRAAGGFRDGGARAARARSPRREGAADGHLPARGPAHGAAARGVRGAGPLRRCVRVRRGHDRRVRGGDRVGDRLGLSVARPSPGELHDWGVRHCHPRRRRRHRSRSVASSRELRDPGRLRDRPAPLRRGRHAVLRRQGEHAPGASRRRPRRPLSAPHAVPERRLRAPDPARPDEQPGRARPDRPHPLPRGALRGREPSERLHSHQPRPRRRGRHGLPRVLRAPLRRDPTPEPRRRRHGVFVVHEQLRSLSGADADPGGSRDARRGRAGGRGRARLGADPSPPPLLRGRPQRGPRVRARRPHRGRGGVPASRRIALARRHAFVREHVPGAVRPPAALGRPDRVRAATPRTVGLPGGRQRPRRGA